jgi:serralysin
MPKKKVAPPSVVDNTGPSSSQTPYVVPLTDDVQITSVLSVGDQPVEGQPWRMVGIPDGLGAFDNGDGTITVLMNHELGATSGATRAHGQAGAFVSKLTIDKETLEVTQAQDLVQDVFFFNRDTDTYVEDVPFLGTPQFGRLCSADLASVSAFFDAATGLGTTERIFLDGEEIGNEGRAFAHIVTGDDEAGDSYELPALGRMSFENLLANPASGARTVVAVTDDSTPGEVYIYVGSKTDSGTTIEKAGLTNGKLFGIAASFGDDTGTTPPAGTFTLVPQGDDGNVTDTTGTQLNALAGAITQFGRPEDGAWDPSNPNRFYFVTTGATVNGVQIPTRLWSLEFVDIEHPELGGTIKVVVEGGVTNSPDQTIPVMLDNMTVTESGLVLMQEDPGNNPRLAKLWLYDPSKDTQDVGGTSGLTLIAQHDPDRFTNPSGPTAAPASGSTTGFGQDEESSGIVDVTDLFGGDKLSFLLDTQAHYTFSPSEFVEGGQLMMMSVDLPNAGDSKFQGGGGADSYDGGFGNDRISGGNGGDTLFGNYGDDQIDGGNGDDQWMAASVRIGSMAARAMTRSRAAPATTTCAEALATITSTAGSATTRWTAATAPISCSAVSAPTSSRAAMATTPSRAFNQAIRLMAKPATTSWSAVVVPTSSSAAPAAINSSCAVPPTAATLFRISSPGAIRSCSISASAPPTCFSPASRGRTMRLGLSPHWCIRT